MAKKQAKEKSLTQDERLAQVLVPKNEQPYAVPPNWVMCPFGNLISSMNSGFACAKRNEISKETSEAYPHLRPNNVGYFGRINLEKIVYIPRQFIDSNKGILPSVSILFNNTNSVELVGRCIFIKDQINYAFSNHLTNIVLTESAKSYTEYISKYIDFLWHWGYFSNICKKWVGQSGVGQDILKKIIIPLPPFAEQRRIVERIESLFEKLDRAKELAQNALDSFETRKAAILHKAFTGELTAHWRKKNGVGMETWEEKELGQIIKLSSGNTLTAKNMNNEGKIPVYGGNGITGYHDQFNIEESTIVIGRVGYYCGSVYLVKEKAWVTDNALITFFDKEKIEIVFLYRLLSFTDLRQNDSSTAQPVISGGKIYPISVTIPSLPEQKEIVRILASLFPKEQRTRELCEIVEKIDLMKKAILARAFRGELGTNDPGEESAVGLVGSIK